MIIADTNVIIDFWNTPTEQAKKVFLYNDIALCGVIKTELLRGAKTEKDFEKMNSSLSQFPCFDFYEKDWANVGFFCYKLKTNGIQVPLADAIIAYLAEKNNAQIWTNDKHFSLIKKIIPELELFEP